jgi:serine phosphatase RsbU (regulator of sigma subunit)
LGAIYHLMHLAGALTEAATVRDIVDLLTDRCLLTFGAQAFALLVPEASRLQIIGHRGVTADLLHRLDHLPETSNALGLLGLAGRTPSFFSSPAELRAAHPALADIGSGMAAWAVLPLIASGQRAGLCLLAYDVPHRFTTEERLTFTSFSALVAQALDRTRVYDAKHQIAHGLQAGLLPHNLPEIPALRVAARYLPASHGMDIGGDFYDLICVSATDAAAVIGDVQGHNVRAAALMGQIRAAVHAYVVSGATPGQILAHTNRLLTDLDPDLLTSCLYARLDLARQRAHLATAGHWPPLVRRPDLRAEVLPMVPGPLLGVDAAAVYPTFEIATPPGTLLAFYTDGLIETPGQDTDLADLGMTLSHAGDDLDDIADTLLDRAQPSGNRADDTALLLLRTAAPRRPGRGKKTHGSPVWLRSRRWGIVELDRGVGADGDGRTLQDVARVVPCPIGVSVFHRSLCDPVGRTRGRSRAWGLSGWRIRFRGRRRRRGRRR